MDFAPDCRPAVQALVARILRRKRNDADVEDCTHETFRRALENQHKLRPDEAVLPWLLGIARHIALDALRSEYRRRARTVDISGEDPDAGQADPGSGPEVLAGHQQRAQRLREILPTLPQEQTRALLLFHFEGLGYREIADQMGVPVGTVGTWVLRARQAIAAAVANNDCAGDRGAP